MSGNLPCGSRSDRLVGAGVGNKDTEVLVTGWRSQGGRRETCLDGESNRACYLGGRRGSSWDGML